MIDWYFVFTNSLWILGCAILLASFSWYDWVATESGRRRREVMKEALPWQSCRSGAFWLVALSQAIAQDRAWWERSLWVLLTLWFSWELLELWWQHRRLPAVTPGDATPPGAS